MPAPQPLKPKPKPALVITKVIKRDPSSPLPQPQIPLKELAPAPDDALFQAIGIISGVVSIVPGTKNSTPRALITIGNKQYPLGYPLGYKRIYNSILNKARKNPNSEQQLIVYPFALHVPGQPYQLSFNVVGWVGKSDRPNGVQQILNKNEFILRGVWQYIPVCRTLPVVSVHKNLTDERKIFMKESELNKKVSFAKATHLPLLWTNSLIPAFRFNPKLDKDKQPQAGFIQVKATLDLEQDCFVFKSLLRMPTMPPPFIKAAKADREEVNKAKAKARKQKAKAC